MHYRLVQLYGIPWLGFGRKRVVFVPCFWVNQDALMQSSSFLNAFSIAIPSGHACLPLGSNRSISLSTCHEELLQLESLHCSLDQQQLSVDGETFSCLLKTCGKLKVLSEGKQVHALICRSGLERDVSLGNNILIMYGKCASLEDAQRMFDQLFQRNVISWTVMIGTYVQCGHCKDALHLFHKMQLECVTPNKITFITILNACNVSDSLEECKMIHGFVVHCGFESDTAVGNSLVSTYAKCGGVMDAQRVFENILERNVVSWTAIIGAFIQLEDCRNSLEFFQQMQVEGVKPNWVTFITVLNACCSQITLLKGKIMHLMIVESEVEWDVVLGSALVKMYGKCGSVEDACKLFHSMSQKNVITWNAIIAMYVHHGLSNEALRFFEHMQQQGVRPDNISFITVLNQCANLADLTEGKMIHACSAELGLESNVDVGSALIKMYGKCGSVVDACRVFEKIQKHHVVSWASLIAVYTQHGQLKEAIQLFYQMQQEGVKPNAVTFASLLSACGGSASPVDGKMIHAQATECGFDSNVAVGCALISMYGRCGDVEAAWRMFKKNMHHQSVVSFNAMIAAFSQHCHGMDVIQLFQMMQFEGVKPNAISFVCVLSACASLTLLDEGKNIHAMVVESGFDSDVVVGSVLVNMFGKCGSVADAQRILDRMHERNVISWNGIMGAYALSGHSKEVLQIFQQMQLEGAVPNEITFITILDACSSFEALQEGKRIHALAIAMGFEGDVVVGNSLVNMYGICGSLRKALDIFDGLHQRNIVSWNAIIGVHSRHMHGKEAFHLFQKMQQEGIELDTISFANVLSACASVTALAEVKMIHVCALGRGLVSDAIVASSLITAYGKCGHASEAQRVFENLNQRDVVSWTALIAVYAHQGHANEALKLFWWMHKEGVKPNQISFLSMLCACCHSGLVDEGCKLFSCMSEYYGITPTVSHYSCMVDLLGRSGRLDEAENLINRMPMEPDAVEWITLLGASRAHGDVDRAKLIAQYVLKLDPQYTAACVVL